MSLPKEDKKKDPLDAKDGLGIVGFLCCSTGVFLLSIPWGLIISGMLLMGLGLLAAARNTEG